MKAIMRSDLMRDMRDKRTGKINASIINPNVDLYEEVPGYCGLHISINKNIYSDLSGYDRYLTIYRDKYKGTEYVMLPEKCHGYTRYNKVSLDKLYRKTFYVPRGYDTRNVLKRAYENGWILSKVREI